MADRTASIAEITGRGMIELRLRPLNAENRRAVAAALGAELPVRPRTSASSGERKILWLSVDQWLVTCPVGETQTLAAEMTKALRGREAAIVDVSDARRVIRITGNAAQLVLMKGTSVDLLHADVTPGYVRRARFADLAALIHCTGSEPDAFDLYVFRSYFDYVKRWLEQTSRSTSLFSLYGSQPAPPV